MSTKTFHSIPLRRPPRRTSFLGLQVLLFALIACETGQVRGCDETTAPLDFAAMEEESRLGMLGEWRNGTYRQLTLNADGTFSRSEMEIRNAGQGNADTMFTAMNGRYTYRNGVWDLSDVQVTFRTTSGKEWPGFRKEANSISIGYVTGDSLIVMPALHLKPLASSRPLITEVAGNWSSVTPCGFPTTADGSAGMIGSVTREFAFEREPTTYTEVITLRNGTTTTSDTVTGSYIFDGQTCTLINSVDYWQVQLWIKENQLYWKYPTIAEYYRRKK